jgi:L-threonylcarbamoyladenylate synthase
MIRNRREIVEYLANGGIAVMATDTLFALSCDATSLDAIDRLYAIKKRDKEKKLPVFFHSLDHVREYCQVPNIAEKLAKHFWPGKLTIILPNKNLQSFSEDIAVRVPGSSDILSIVKDLGRPIIGTSANISGCRNLYDIEEIEAKFSETNIAIFIGKTEISKVQSTIVDIRNDKIEVIREGAVSVEEIEKVLRNTKIK